MQPVGAVTVGLAGSRLAEFGAMAESAARGRVVSDDGLRPLERRLLRWRHYGATYTEIGPRFRRSPAFVARVEAFARYKLEDRPAIGGSGASFPSMID